MAHGILLDFCKLWSLLFIWVQNKWRKLSSISYIINSVSALVKEMDMFSRWNINTLFSFQNLFSSELRRRVQSFLWMHFGNYLTQKKNNLNKLAKTFWAGNCKISPIDNMGRKNWTSIPQAFDLSFSILFILVNLTEEP